MYFYSSSSPFLISLSRGRYRRLLPPSTSIITLVLEDRTSSTASRYNLCLVTSGAFLYSTRSAANLSASPSATATT